MPLSIRIILLIVMLLCSAFFSMTESAFSYCNQIRMKIAADEGSKSAKLVLRCLDKFDRYIVTNLIGNNIVNNLFSAMSTTLCGLLLLSFMSAEDAKSWGSIITIIVGTLVVFFVGENIPKNVGKAFPNAICKIVVYPLYFLAFNISCALAIAPCKFVPFPKLGKSFSSKAVEAKFLVIGSETFESKVINASLALLFFSNGFAALTRSALLVPAICIKSYGFILLRLHWKNKNVLNK